MNKIFRNGKYSSTNFRTYKAKWYKHLVGCFRGLDHHVVDLYFEYRDSVAFNEGCEGFGNGRLFTPDSLDDFNQRLDSPLNMGMAMLYQRYYNYCHPTALAPIHHGACPAKFKDIRKYYPYILDGKYSKTDDDKFYGIDFRHRYHLFHKIDWDESDMNRSCEYCIPDCNKFCIEYAKEQPGMRKFEDLFDRLFNCGVEFDIDHLCLEATIPIERGSDSAKIQSIKKDVEEFCMKEYANSYEENKYIKTMNHDFSLEEIITDHDYEEKMKDFISSTLDRVGIKNFPNMKMENPDLTHDVLYACFCIADMGGAKDPETYHWGEGQNDDDDDDEYEIDLVCGLCCFDVYSIEDND